MEPYRYDQFCPLARAAEVLGQRWTLPILREFSAGPVRFTDLRARLPGISPSVLTGRLASLEGYGVVERGTLAPTSAPVYRLTPHGEELRPVLLALTRWGLRWLGTPREGDHIDPEWLRLAVAAFAAPGPTPAYRYELQVAQGERSARIRFGGGRRGPQPIGEREPVDATLRVTPQLALGLLSGNVSAMAARETGASLEGDADALAALPRQFHFSSSPAPPTHKGASK